MAANGDGVESEDEEDELRDSRSNKADDWEENDEGRVEEECVNEGREGGAQREEPLLRDWVVSREDEEEENRSDVRESKGSGFHCASLWNPFSPLL